MAISNPPSGSEALWKQSFRSLASAFFTEPKVPPGAQASLEACVPDHTSSFFVSLLDDRGSGRITSSDECLSSCLFLRDDRWIIIKACYGGKNIVGSELQPRSLLTSYPTREAFPLLTADEDDQAHGFPSPDDG